MSGVEAAQVEMVADLIEKHTYIMSKHTPSMARVAGLNSCATEILKALSAIEGGGGSSAAPIPTEHPWPLVVALCESLRDNDDPNEPIADNGASVLDGWRDLAKRILAAPTEQADGGVVVPRDQLETLRRSLELGSLLPGEGETLINCWIFASEAESKA